MNHQDKQQRQQDKILAIRPQAIDTFFCMVEEEPPVAKYSVYIQNGVATIVIDGPLESRMNFRLGYDLIKQQLAEVLSNSLVKQIYLQIDSPGGDVLGLSELADFIYVARKQKPIIAIVQNMACSAAYWLAAACSKIILAGKTTIVGSIGVLSIHRDESGALEKFGIKITEVSSGKYKNLVSPNHALTPEGNQYLQDQVNQFYNIFTSSIAKYRGMSSAKVLELADGREFIGLKAIELGLADSMQGVFSMNPEEMQQKIDELTKENETLRKENEDLKQKLPVEKPSESAQEVKEEEKKSPDEEEKIGANVSQANKALAQDRARILDLLSIDRGAATHDLVMKAIENGTSAEKVSLQILQNQTRVERSVRADMKKESKSVAAVHITDGLQQEAIAEMIAKSANQNRRS